MVQNGPQKDYFQPDKLNVWRHLQWWLNKLIRDIGQFACPNPCFSSSLVSALQLRRTWSIIKSFFFTSFQPEQFPDRVHRMLCERCCGHWGESGNGWPRWKDGEGKKIREQDWPNVHADLDWVKLMVNVCLDPDASSPSFHRCVIQGFGSFSGMTEQFNEYGN